MTFKVKKLRWNARLPVRAHDGDAGYDLFYCPNGKPVKSVTGCSDLATFHGDGESLMIAPGDSVLIPTGIATQFETGHMFEIKNRSSVASKKQLIVGAAVCDEKYRGEIWINLHNISSQNQIIDTKTAIAQGVLVRISTPKVIEVDELEETIRGENGFGSTDKS